MGRIVIACYRPKAGREAELDALVAGHWTVLRAQGLVTGRPPAVMRSRDGTVIEVFEWASPAAIEAAHHDERVRELWERFGEVSEFVPVRALPEAEAPFPDFEAVARPEG